MENGVNPREREILSTQASSPNARSCSSTSNSGGGGNRVFWAPATPTAKQTAAPPTPKSIQRFINPNPYPTTFIQANVLSFKQVVQMLTGSVETAAKHASTDANPPAAPLKSQIPPAAKATCPKKPAFKLYERRGSMKNLKMISPLIPAFAGMSSTNSLADTLTPRKLPEILSPSILDLPSLVMSPVTPLIPDPFGRSPEPRSTEAAKAEETAIAGKGFYFYPSPRSTPQNAEPPRLLPLFPMTAPRVSSFASP